MRKKVLITGGNKGIGLETTRMLVESGYEVFVVARRFNDFEFADNELVHMVEFDVADIKGIADVVKSIGPVDILINNAGIMNSIPYNQYPDEEQERIMNVNLYAPIEFIKWVVEDMKKAGYGRIVNTASVAGQIGHPDIWYGISKAGIINATKSFAKILAPDGITVNAVAPSPVKTDMLAVIPESRKQFMKSMVYSGRFAEAEEIATTIYWLVTDCPEYINGVCIDINNGSFPR